MAIKSFKEIIDNKGYLVDAKDRTIFEKEIGRSNFGNGESDSIEFVLYDANDNILPQGDTNAKVKYIHLNDENIRKYFLMAENPSNKKTNGAFEYIIDVEKLIQEAGYKNGIFKSQITLLNRRVGSEEKIKDKLWINEISPSRTEIRVLPLKDGETINPDLEARYNVLIEDGQFRDDTIYFVQSYVQNIDIQKVLETIIAEKGTEADGIHYINKIKNEFQIYDFDKFLLDVKTLFVKNTEYFIQNRDYHVNSINHGKPLTTPIPIDLSLSKIKETCISILIESIDHYLIKRNLTDENVLTDAEQITIDALQDILVSSTSDDVFESRGCTDPNALNYNSLAKIEDGSCLYNESTIEILGCTDPNSLNYNPAANKDDNSCVYGNETTKTFYVWSSTGTILYIDKFGKSQSVTGNEYDKLTITYQKTPTFTGDIREIPKLQIPSNSYSYLITYNLNNQFIYDVDSADYFEYERFGNEFIDKPISREILITGNSNTPMTFSYINSAGANQISQYLSPGESVTVCAKEGSISATSIFSVRKLGSCGRIEFDDNILPNANVNLQLQ
jgi:hypothetical protein